MIDVWLRRLLALVLATFLFAMMALTFVDVIGRYFFNAPVPGAFELTQLAMGLVVFSALPMATWAREHVAITIIDHFVAPAATRRMQMAADLFSAVMLVLLGWRMFVHGRQLASYGEATTFLHIPFAPFVYLMSAMAILAAGACLVLAVRDITGRDITGRAVADEGGEQA